MNARPRVAFIIQRCGREVNGGAESYCLQVAQRLVRHWDVEVLTTCALDYMEWRNHYPPGHEIIGDVMVRRFPVDIPRDVAQFDQLSAELTLRSAEITLADQVAWMHAQGPISTPLLDHLEIQRESYDAFIFFGYLYATTYFGLPKVQDRAWLVPLAHDEWTIHLPMWNLFFRLPRGFIFNTEEEREFLLGRFPGVVTEGPIAGVGIEVPARLNPEGFRRRHTLTEHPFLLYAGRIDASKGCAEMFIAFLRARREGIPHRLVLIGKEILPVPFDDNIIHLGFVAEQEKWDAMAACDWLVMPSRYESLSIVLLETWAVCRPALVNAASKVLVGHCRRSNGGLWYDGTEGWGEILLGLDKETRGQLGRQGAIYVRENYYWERIEAQYLCTVKTSKTSN